MSQERNPKRTKTTPLPLFPSSSSQSSLLTIDRISTLEDPILHDILNLLPTKTVARTATLSKRFNALWLTNPIMDFNEYDHCKKPTDTLLHRMERAYESHDFSCLGALKIRVREPIRKTMNKDLTLMVERFFVRAFGRDVLKEMQLHFRISKKSPTVADLADLDKFNRRFYVLPEMPFSKTLKSLKLRGCRFEAHAEIYYGGIFLPILKELEFKYCSIPDVNFIPRFIDGCRQLEKISFKYFLPGLRIRFSSSKVKIVVLSCYDAATTYEIAAPNLQSLKITGANRKHTANDGVDVGYHPQYIFSAPNVETLSFKHMSLNRASITRVLTTFMSTKELEISHSVFADEPIFESRKIEKLEILKCAFNDVNLSIASSRLPQAKLVHLFSCKGLRNLTLHTRGLEFRTRAFEEAFTQIHRINVD